MILPRPQIPPGYLGRIHSPRPHDVLSGRGARFNSHPGNIYFRGIIESCKQEYLDPRTKINEKAHINARIVANVRSLGGRFLKEEYPGCYLEIGDELAWKKAELAWKNVRRALSKSGSGTGGGQSRKVQQQQQSRQADPPHPSNKRMKIADNRASQHVYAHKYIAKFNALSEEDQALLEELNSSYDGEHHDVKAGFRDTVIYCLEQRNFEQCDLYWYLRLFNDQYGPIPFTGNSSDDILLKKLVSSIQRAKDTDRISIIRKKHMIAQRSTEDAIDMTARFFERLGTARNDSKKRAEEAFMKLSDMLCHDDDDEEDEEGYECVY